MKRSSLRYGPTDLEYIRFGNGPRTILAMHGFGQSAIAFDHLARALGDEYSVISLSLPHHGNSTYNGKGYHTPEVVSLIEALLDHEGIGTFDLLGFSTGGRIAMCVTPFLADRMNGLYLMAPDGVIHHPLYYFATKTLVGRWLHELFINNQTFVYKLAQLAIRIGIVRPVQLKFLKINSENAERRRLAFDTWGSFRKMEPDLWQIRTAMNNNNLSIQLFYGRYDRIIPARQGLEFRRVVGPEVKLQVLKKGHGLTRSDVLSTVAAEIKNPAG